MLGADDVLMYLSDPAQALPNLLTGTSGATHEPGWAQPDSISTGVCHTKPPELTAQGSGTMQGPQGAGDS